MANQMTPDEMREAATRLREGRFPDQGAWRTSDFEAGADALDNLAEIREAMTDAVAESEADDVEGGAGWDVEVDARWVLRIAEGGA